MPKFAYEGVDRSRKTAKGTVDAANEEEARAKLREQGLRVTALSAPEGGGKRKKAAAAAPTERKKATVMGGVNQAELTLFSRQFATLLDAGLPMPRSLQILENMLRPGVLRNALMDVYDDVNAGSTLSDSMGKHPKVFDTLYTSIVRSGEAAGALDTMLLRLADFREKSQKLKKQIIGALIYPAAVITIAGLILALIILLIVPKFQKMFTDMKMEMPTPTVMLMSFADFLQNYYYIVFSLPFVLLAIFKLICHFPAGRFMVDQVSLYLPVFGTIIRKSSISRFCRTLGTLTSSGVPILDALNIIRTAIGNKVVENAVGEIHTAIREGEGISEPMKRQRIFDQMMVSMVEVGEETGELDKMLIKDADNLDADVDTLVSSMLSLLEPFLIIGMGLAVGFIVISLFMPILSIVQNMGA